MTTFLYARVSTEEQTLDHQLTQARQAGFEIADEDVIADHGVSGVSARLVERPQGHRLFDILRRGDVLVVRWVDRLGRDYDDVTGAIRAFMKKGVIIKTVINGFTFDGKTTDPVQKAVRDALIAFMAATAQAQAEATKDAQRAGIAHARAINPKAYRGRRPSFNREQFERVQALLANGGVTTSEIAREVGLDRICVHRMKADPAAHEAMLVNWEL
jgi:putative DNA-invertase from lambdoid prophage Rac